jgi:hypothetical protein
MAVDTVSPRSRRAILAATLGGLAGTVLVRLGGPEPARATNGGAIILGNSPSGTLDGIGTNEASATTAISTTGGTGFWATSPSGIGLVGNSTSSIGVFGSSNSSSGVYGTSTSYVGVYGQSDGYIGVFGSSSSTERAGVAGHAVSNSSGVEGYSGPNTFPVAKAKTGVFGLANLDKDSRGVFGDSPAGHGIHGHSSTGWAGFFDGRVFTNKYHELVEISTPSAPSSNHARLFVRDNGSGKTQLCVRFATGAVKVLATES